jgi:IS5 family transposase
MPEKPIKLLKTRASPSANVYRKVEQAPSSAEEFELPNGCKLAEDNRWVSLAQLIPWAEFEQEYAQNFETQVGAPAKSFRMALGALIIKEKLGISDRETVEQIRENPYLQYFIGQSSYSNEIPFDPSLLVHFRQRISAELVNKVNREVVRRLREPTRSDSEKKNQAEQSEPPKNQGKLILDATCAPADISYPTDFKLLNQARVHTERIIDVLYSQLKEKIQQKPRTYRHIARKNYLEVARKRQPSRKQKRKAIKKQLQYLKRNLSHISQLIESGASLKNLSKRQYKALLVVSEVYRQQSWLFKNNKQSIEDRIVSLSQPQIRPIVRGKAGKSVEFGAKLVASCFEGYVFLDRISWDNFNESGDFKAQIEAYRNFTGFYPESVHVDQIYRTRENRAWCKQRGIRISGPPLGRPPAHVSRERKKQALDSEKIRNSIEGKFGQAKRRFSLQRVMAQLPNTSQTAIAITFLVMNLCTALLRFFCVFFCAFAKTTLVYGLVINKSYCSLDEIKHSLILSSP